MAKRVWHRNAAKERFWRRAMAEQRRSGLTIREFCARRSLSEPSFYAWRRELALRDGRRSGSRSPGQASAGKRPAPPPDERPAPPRDERITPPVAQATPRFVALQLASETAATAMIEIVTRGGHTLRVPPGADGQTLAQVWALLEGRPC